ncbi:hypothetical protein EXE58_09880 [Nocardioides seonyuensis]|uniref:Uncharacterized protein n=1 Tax=Nocardioides seonyuensis TaxID=2518371 RepID=A0A4P7IIM3_9ACTN|nr:hypothetical protein [Nocardioides seonyuensis]QBX55731.1 hypothetical protein EXE58_09880 [Nocardioides seonyuensis]
MASYDDLNDMIGPLKRAAIDAYMCSNNWGGFLGYRIVGDKYFFAHPNVSGSYGTTTEEVDRPNEQGEGGGRWKMRIPMAFDPDAEDKYVDDFNNIRDRIDEALRPWKWLPEPADIAEMVESVRQANRILSLDAVNAGGTVTGGGEIGGNINLILENSDAMAGGMITAFKANFLAQLGKAVAGHHAITIVLGGMLAAEWKIWEQARQTVADLVEQSTQAFDAAAEGGDIDWDVVLKVAGYAVAGAAIFATAGTGAATALAVAGLGIKILDGAVPASGSGTETDAPGGDFDSVMDSFEGTLKDLDTAIEDEETILEDNLRTNLSQIRADKSSYDLERPPIMDIDDDSDLGAPSEIRIEPVLVKEITETYLPNIRGELMRAANRLQEVVSLSAIHRDSSLGLGSYGPREQYHDLRDLGYELIRNLQLEVSYSAKSLQLGVEDILVTDSDQQDALEAHAQRVIDLEIGQPTGPYNPWN